MRKLPNTLFEPALEFSKYTYRVSEEDKMLETILNCTSQGYIRFVTCTKLQNNNHIRLGHQTQDYIIVLDAHYAHKIFYYSQTP